MAPKRGTTKRLGKKHRQAATRPKKGKAPRPKAQVASAAPKKRKEMSTREAAAAAAKKRPQQSQEFERKVTIDRRADDRRAEGSRGKANETQIPFGNDKPKSRGEGKDRGHGSEQARRGEGLAPSRPKVMEAGGAGSRHEEREWREAEKLAGQITLGGDGHGDENEPLVAICGRPNVGKSTLFNRLTQSRRSIVGDEPGITRDRIYGEVEWEGRTVRLVDTGGVVPDDEALIPSEIFRQAKVGLEEADAIIMVVDGRTELAAPDVELSRLLLRGGKPLFLAVNKIDSAEMFAAAENFRTLGFKNVVPISAEHGNGIGDLLDEVWAVLPPEPVAVEPTEVQDGFDEEFEEDMDGGGDPLPGAPEPLDEVTQDGKRTTPERKLRTHGEHVARETKIAIIGRPNVGKSTLLNALTGTDRAIVSPIAGTTRDAVDEVVERDGHSFRFIDTAGIRRKGKTKLMAEKLSVIMSRKHLEAADVALLVIDAVEGVTAADAHIGGYAHESGRSVIIVVNKWDLVAGSNSAHAQSTRMNGAPHAERKPADKKVYEEQVRDALKYLDYAPLLFVSAAEAKGIEEVFKKVELVARERRKRVSTGAMNRFLDKIDFQRASVPLSKRIKIYYMTQAAVAPPTFVLFTDRDVKLHFSYERFLQNEIRRTFRFIGSPIWFKIKARNKKKEE